MKIDFFYTMLGNKPWCIYFWQITGRIGEEQEADGGDEYQP